MVDHDCPRRLAGKLLTTAYDLRDQTELSRLLYAAYRLIEDEADTAQMRDEVSKELTEFIHGRSVTVAVGCCQCAVQDEVSIIADFLEGMGLLEEPV